MLCLKYGGHVGGDISEKIASQRKSKVLIGFAEELLIHLYLFGRVA